ncbi:MAG TPA: chemotaxis protein CheW [bacterium]|jgi:purine-binding chemotaxis protein CheW|nr:chemotaxis protein CheW [bacterium]
MSVMRQQFRSLGALLMENGLLTKEQLDSALSEQKRSGEKLGRILVARGWVRDKDILTVLNGMMMVVLQLQGEDYGIETLQVREIIRYQRGRPLSGEPRWLEGVIDYRGRVVPVVDLRQRLGIPPAEDGDALRVIVYEGVSGKAWGLKVDSVSAVIQVASEQLDDAPEGWKRMDLPLSWLAGLARLEGKTVALLNVEELLAAGALEDFR